MKRTKIDANQFELEDTVVAIKRVSKTVKGGRTMRFSALVVVGDKNGHVGAGMGKAAEVPEAIRKGKEAAARNLMEVPFDENNSIPHDFLGKFGSANVLLKKAPEGTGIIAGGPARAVLDLAGYQEHPYKIPWFQQQGKRSSCYPGRLRFFKDSGRGCKTSR